MSERDFDPTRDLQVIIGWRHGKPIEVGTFPPVNKFKHLHPAALSMLMLMAQFVAGKFPFRFNAIMHSDTPRSAESAKLWLATVMIMHPDWRNGLDILMHRGLLPWSDTRQLDMISQAFAATKAHIADHGGTVVEAAFALPECNQALVMSAHDGVEALHEMVPYDEAPGVFVLGGMHSPQIDALGLRLAGVASITKKTGFTHENVMEHLKGYSRQGEGWIVIKNLRTGHRTLIPLKWTSAIEKMYKAALAQATRDQERYLERLKKAGIPVDATLSS